MQAGGLKIILDGWFAKLSAFGITLNFLPDNRGGYRKSGYIKTHFSFRFRNIFLSIFNAPNPLMCSLKH